MYFSCNVSYSSLPVFLPTIIEAMGFTSVNAQGLSAPPYFVAFMVTISSAWFADRIQQRGLVIIFLSLVGCLGYILLAACTSIGARYFGTFLAASGVFPAIANIIPWVLNNQGSDTRRGMGIVILNVVGQCGPLLGTRVFPSKQGPRYVEGQAICAAFMGFNAFLALSLRTLLAWENKKLDRKYGVIEEQQGEKGEQMVDANVGEENTGPKFRFVL
jgi:dipeptide/tripeptide permease